MPDCVLLSSWGFPNENAALCFLWNLRIKCLSIYFSGVWLYPKKELEVPRRVMDWIILKKPFTRNSFWPSLWIRVRRHPFMGLERPYLVSLIEGRSVDFRSIWVLWKVKGSEAKPGIFFRKQFGVRPRPWTSHSFISQRGLKVISSWKIFKVRHPRKKFQQCFYCTDRKTVFLLSPL